MSTIKKFITKSNSRQIKSKQTSLTYTSSGKIWERFSMQLVNRSTKKQRGAKLKNTFLFLKTINFTVINVIRYHLKSLKFSFIYP